MPRFLQQVVVWLALASVLLVGLKIYQDVVYNPQKVIDEVRQVLRGRVIR